MVFFPLQISVQTPLKKLLIKLAPETKDKPKKPGRNSTMVIYNVIIDFPDFIEFEESECRVLAEFKIVHHISDFLRE